MIQLRIHRPMNLETINHFAKLAQAAYLDSKEAKKVYKELGYDWHVLKDIDGAQCHIIKKTDENITVLCFRGTEPDEISDILADLKAFPRRSMIDKGLVHRGFRGELDKIWHEIENTLKTLPKTKGRLYVCGHSLGAAMATLATSRMQHKVWALYTFGSPRVGTRRFIKNLYTKHFRVVNNNDIVTRVPPRLMFYRHHGELVYINHYGNIRKMTPWQRIKDRFRGYRDGLLDPVTDHSMLNYINHTKTKEK
jgi:triacylglycerol lipase